MICKNCGTEIKEGENVCPVCGAAVSAAPEAAAECTVKAPFGLSLAAIILSEWGLIGLILAIVAKVKMKNYKNAGGLVTGKAKAANILSTLALIISILSMIYIAFCILIGIGLALSGEFNNIVAEFGDVTIHF